MEAVARPGADSPLERLKHRVIRRPALGVAARLPESRRRGEKRSCQQDQEARPEGLSRGLHAAISAIRGWEEAADY